MKVTDGVCGDVAGVAVLLMIAIVQRRFSFNSEVFTTSQSRFWIFFLFGKTGGWFAAFGANIVSTEHGGDG